MPLNMATFLAPRTADHEPFLTVLEERGGVQQREGALGGLQLTQSNSVASHCVAVRIRCWRGFSNWWIPNATTYRCMRVDQTHHS